MALLAKQKAARAQTAAECDYALADIGEAIAALSGGPNEATPSPYILKLLEERDAYIARRETLCARPVPKSPLAKQLFAAVEELDRVTDSRGNNICAARPIAYADAWRKVRRVLRRIDGGTDHG